MSSDPLDSPVWGSLTGTHLRFAEVLGQAVRYYPEVAPFVAFTPGADDGAWRDLAQMVGPDVVVSIPGAQLAPPDEWEIVRQGAAMQLTGADLSVERDPEAVALGKSDVPEMLELVGRTQPGPFRPRTVELGHYLGLRHEGRLVAMAGERLHPVGWTEISAVCTDETQRGRGLATRLVRAIGAGVRDRGETPFLHVAATNEPAIRLYRSLGFEFRREVTFLGVRTPPAEIDKRPEE